MSENINTTAAKSETATAVKTRKPKAKELSLKETYALIEDVDNSAFPKDEGEDLMSKFYLTFCDVLIAYVELHHFFSEEFKDVVNIPEFFDDYQSGKYVDYLAAINKTKTSKIVDEFVERRKQMIISKLNNPVSETFSKINEILDNLSEDFKDIEPDTFKKFIGDFGNFAKETNPESVTDAMLKKVISENKTDQSESDQKKG